MSAKLNLLSDFFLNRFQTVSIYKEIVHLSESVGYNAVNLKLTEKNEAATQSYQLQITMPMNSLIAQQIATIAKKHRLEVKEENGEVMLYEPQ